MLLFKTFRMKKTIFIIAIICAVSSVSCKKEWLQRESKSLILEEQVWNDPKQLTSLLANYYDRLPTDIGLTDVNDALDGRLSQWRNMADYDDAMWSGQSNQDGRNNLTSYATNRWFLWNYTLIRDINKTIDGVKQYSTEVDATTKSQFIAELRFL